MTRSAYPECYAQYRSMANVDTSLWRAKSSVYGQEFAGFCEDYTEGMIPLAYSQWTSSLMLCNISIHMEGKHNYTYTRSRSFPYNSPAGHRHSIYKDFIENNIRKIWHMKHIEKDRFSLL